jgi:hypothetical protein
MKCKEFFYKAIFSNLKGFKSYEADCFSGHYYYPIVINGVTLEIDGFELLTIENPNQYSEVQLAQFDYYTTYPYEDKGKKELVLKNYKLEIFIPINILNIESKERINTEFQIRLDCNDNIAKRTCVIMGKSSHNLDLGYAFAEIQEQLKEHYYLMVCSNCKNHSWHPYGFDDFFNQLCFKREAEGFQAIKNKDKMSISGFMKYGDESNFQLVHLMDYCNNFDPK